MLHCPLMPRRACSFFRSIAAFSAIVLTALPAPLPAKDIDVYFIGNSLTGNIQREDLEEIVDNHSPHTMDHDMTGAAGAPIDWLWEDPVKGQEIRDDFARGGWDATTVQPFVRDLARDVPPTLEILDAALVDNPDIQLHVYATWVKNEGFDYATAWLQDVTKWIETGNQSGLYTPNFTKQYFETLTRRLREQQPQGSRPVEMVPAGHAMFLLDQKIKAGLVDLDGPASWMNDGVHTNNIGSFLVGMTFYATLYEESPVGLPAGGYNDPNAAGANMSPQLQEQLQQIAWETVTGTELTGVQGAEPVQVVSPGIFKNPVQGEPYHNVLLAGYGPKPYTWSVAGGALPQGLQLGADGWLTGTPVSTGEFSFTAQVTDNSGNTATREFDLTVEADIAITAGEFEETPVFRAGEVFRLALPFSGGNGDPVWSLDNERWALAGGDFPRGSIWLNPAGYIEGAAGRPGTYRFRVNVKDGDLGSPETDSTEVMINILPPNSDVFYVRQHATRPDIANPNDPLWDLQPLPLRMVEGTGELQAFIDLGWDDSKNLMGVVHVIDENVFADSEDLTQDDSVEILIDGAHNQETEFNADDRQIIIRNDGATAGRIEPIASRRAQAATLTEDGYGVGFRNNRLPLKHEPYSSIGFDLQVYNDDDGGDRDSSAVLGVGSTEGENQKNWKTAIFTGVAIIRPQNVEGMWAGKELNYQCEAAFGTPPYTWSASNLADGLSVSSDGIISGVPTGDGPEFLWLTVTDADGNSRQVTWSYFPMHPNPDSDNDNLPDDWERLYYPDLDAIDASSDLDEDGIPALAEMVMDFDPTTPNSWELESELLEDESGRWMVVRWRRNTAFPMASTSLLWRSDDLQNWTPVVLDGFNAVELIVDPDVDGDGSAELVEARVRVPDGHEQVFLKMEPQIVYLDERP